MKNNYSNVGVGAQEILSGVSIYDIGNKFVDSQPTAMA